MSSRQAPTTTTAARASSSRGPRRSAQNNTPTPSASTTSRHHSRRRLGLPSRTTPSGSTTVRREDAIEVMTDPSGSPSAISSTIGQYGVISPANTPISNGLIADTMGRPSRKSATPSSIPANTGGSVSAAAIRRTCAASAPTSRIADSRRSRSAPAIRELDTTNISTGMSRATTPRAISKVSSIGSGSEPT